MKAKSILIGMAIIFCAGLGIFALIRMRSPASNADDESADENVPTIVSVQVGALKRMTLHRYVTAYGTIEAAPAMANQPAAGGILAAPTAGIVSKINVIAGQRVKKGDVLVELNSGAATFNYAKAEVQRQRQLFAQQNTSLKSMQDAESQLASLEIVAPVSGTVTSVNVIPGQAVDASSVVAVVIDLNRLAVSVKIPEGQADELHAGQKVQILIEPPVMGTLSFVSPTINPDDGTVQAWVSLPPNFLLRPGQFVQLKIVTATHTNCLVAPAEGVVTDEAGSSVISVVNNSEATQMSVQTGFQEDGWVEIKAPGLQESNRVVTVGAYGLPEKTKILIINTPDENSSTNSPVAQ